MLPFGVMEKLGPAGPVATDLLNIRHATIAAAETEYAIVFPEYYFGQIFEAEHQPRTISNSGRLQLELLQETAAGMARSPNDKERLRPLDERANTQAVNPFFLGQDAEGGGGKDTQAEAVQAQCVKCNTMQASRTDWWHFLPTGGYGCNEQG